MEIDFTFLLSPWFNGMQLLNVPLLVKCQVAVEDNDPTLNKHRAVASMHDQMERNNHKKGFN